MFCPHIYERCWLSKSSLSCCLWETTQHFELINFCISLVAYEIRSIDRSLYLFFWAQKKLQIFDSTPEKCQNQTQIDLNVYPHSNWTNHICRALIKIESFLSVLRSRLSRPSCYCIEATRRHAERNVIMRCTTKNKDFILKISYAMQRERHCQSCLRQTAEIIYLKSNNLPRSAGMLSSLHQKWKLYNFCNNKTKRRHSCINIIARDHTKRRQRDRNGSCRVTQS